MIIIYNHNTAEYNIFNGSEKIASFTESALQLIASQNNMAWPFMISQDCHEIKHIVEIAL